MQILFTPPRYQSRFSYQRLGALGETKAQGLNAWIDANAAVEATERLLYRYATEFRDNAYWVTNDVKKLRDEFDVRRAEVETYGEWTTRWSKYIGEANEWANRANGLLAQMNAVLLQLPPPGQGGGDTGGGTPPPPPPPGDRKPESKSDNTMLWVAGGITFVIVALVAVASRKK